MDYKARMYDAYLNRWVQPDTIIPDPLISQSWNRYSYVNNNPILYNDPSGHRLCENGNCDQVSLVNKIYDDYSWTLLGNNWTARDIKTIYFAGKDISRNVDGNVNVQKLFGEVRFSKDVTGNHGGETLNHRISLNINSDSWGNWTIAHELGHDWDQTNKGNLSRALEGFTGGHTDQSQGKLYKDGKSSCVTAYSPGCNNAGYYYGDVPPKGSDSNFNRGEDFAESFAALIYPNMALDVIKSLPRKNISYFQYDDYTTTLRGLWMASAVDIYTR
ncbi:MAG: RHS repeat-associated core domain-containing protein [Anaerolineaceae bacterium]|nr:RHS repeat-associated core domain-containing protein [Anaerolineaceae bacterium]